jgi:hypothetical protein
MRKINPIVIVLCLIQAIIIVLILYTINNVLNTTSSSDISSKNQSSKFEITNYKESGIDISQQEWNNIKEIIANKINENVKNDTFPKKLSINIRNSSIIKKYYEEPDFYYYNFIVDIPKLSSSYQIKIDYSKNPDNNNISINDSRAINCIEDKSKIKYKQQVCRMSQYDLNKYSILSMYYQYEDFGDLIISADPNNFKKIVVNMTSTDETEEQAKKKVDAWIKSMGYTPDGFQYEFYDGDSL